jgi:hypothetical protein
LNKAHVARFYGWTPKVVNSLDVQDFHDYFVAIESVRAVETLHGLVVADWPNLKESERNKRWKQLQKLASPVKSSKPGKTLTNAELAEILKKH